MADLTQGMVVNNRYTLKEYKGRGSFGEVWLAHDNVLGIDVALKIYISLDQRGVDEFKSEYTTTLGLSHPYLLTASFFDVWDNRPFLVMKFCENGSSSGIVGKATELQVWQFLHDVADGLAYLHDLAEPIIHQDIKPDNILIDGENKFVITDFGISKRVRATMRKQSKRAVGAGATAYMGPERFGEDSSPVKASDIWSLGISAYELVTGELPFSGMGGGMQRNGAERPNLPQGWSPNLNDLIRRCMDKETWDRPTARDIADYTRQVLDGNNISYKQWKESPKEASKKSVKKVVIGIAAGVFVLAVILVAALFFFGKKVEVQDDNAEIAAHYRSMYEKCDNNINLGSDAAYQSLISAKNLIDSLKYYREEYPELENEEGIDIATLESKIEPKLAEASKAWAESADAQLTLAEDPQTSMEHYHIAALLKDDDQVKQGLEKIAKITGCQAAPVIIWKAQLDGKKLRIAYMNVSDQNIADVPVVYSLMNGKKEVGTAQTTVTFDKGNRNTLTIMLKADADDTFDKIIFKNNNLIFATTPVSRVALSDEEDD